MNIKFYPKTEGEDRGYSEEDINKIAVKPLNSFMGI